MSTVRKLSHRSKQLQWKSLGAWKIPEPGPRQRSAFRSALSETTLSFCQETSLHGVRNVVDDIRQLGSTRYSKQQKLVNVISLSIWISACVIGAVFAITLIGLVWTRFQSTPTITTVETNNFPIWNVRFPAITICNNNKVYRPAANKIKQKLVLHGLQPARVDIFLGQLTKLVIPEYVDEPFEKTHALLLKLNYTTERLMFELMQPCDNMLSNCTWLGKSQPCETLFRVAKSAEGFCCSFNYKAPLDELEVDTEHDYIEDQLENPIYRVSGAGQYVGLDVLINVEPTEYVSYSKAYFGAAILVHGTQDFPQGADKATVGQPGMDVTVAVIPSVVVSEKSIRELALNQRNCYFDDEIKLRTTNKYTYQSCISECAVDTILDICDCLPFYYAEVHLRIFSKTRRQCTLNDADCLRHNRHIFSSLQPPEGNNETLGMNCPKCKPSCSEESFSVQTISANRMGINNFYKNNLQSFQYGDLNLSNIITLKVHFKDISCIKYRRDVFLTWDGLFASFGGIFGLCLGGSIISLIEFFYFFTFKFCNNLRSGIESSKIAFGQPLNQISGSKLKIHKSGLKFIGAQKVVHVGMANAGMVLDGLEKGKGKDPFYIN